MKKNIVLSALSVAVILALFLRGFNLGRLVTPYWEEMALGYDAYSIARTGADHHGNFWPLVAFESFGDWKPSGYFYAAAASIKVFGPTILAVRLPSFIAGMALVVGMYFLSRLLLTEFAPRMSVSQRQIVQVSSVMLAAVSSWLLMFSRAAWEVNLATALVVWAVVLFLLYVRGKSWLWSVLSVLLFVLSAYTYHATRIIAPALLLALLVYSFVPKAARFLKLKKKKFSSVPLLEFSIGIVFLLLMMPLLSSLRSPEVSQRFAETSIFSRLDIILESNQARELSGTPGAKLFFHRYVLFSREIVSNLFSHFSLDFLFVHGDLNKRHSTGYMGHLYYLDLPLLLVGFYALVKRYRKLGLVLLFWILAGVVPASISLATPHALRILPIAPVLLFIASLGFSEGWILLVKNQKKLQRRVGIGVICVFLCLYAVQVFFFWRYYTKIYPAESSLEWQYGYQEAVVKAEHYVESGKLVAFTRGYGRPAMYYFFMNAVDPKEVQAFRSQARFDQSEFTSFKNIFFYDSVADATDADIIFAAPSERITTFSNEFNLVDSISSPTGETLWEVYEK
ncbi:MAG: hypothetical protein H6773_01420 [Pseudomonadales bacterium]|nr:hypothetical protein [Candidatus Woesebacteria bacterium]MCB9800816.1 hypothetical protein [Pseudomonadales bacterium]